jgi:GAF domain-containing protein
MGQGAKPAKAEARPSVTGKSRKIVGSKGRQLEQRLTEALEQQAATSEILHAISSSPTDLDPVFRMILANATRLCGASVATLWLFDGELLSSVAHQNASPEFAEYLARARIRPSRETTTRRAALERKTIHVADLLSDPDYSPPEFQRKEKVNTVLSVPLLRQDTLVGVVTLWRREVRPFTDRQVALVETFADQAVIAVENVRLFKELETRNRDLTEALEQQTATSEILRVISRSPTDVQLVFDTIAAAALKLCGASSANVFTFDGELIHLATFVNVNPEFAAVVRQVFPRPPGRDTAVGRAILARNIVAIPDVLEDREFAIGRQSLAGGFRSALSVPLIRDGSPIGAISVGRPAPGPFPDKQIELLKTFADQAVIAIENVRLFKELESRNRDLTEALEQQTATSDILRVISQSPTDVQPVFDTIAAAALKLCRASSGAVMTFDGELIHLAAVANLNPEGADAIRRVFPRPPGRDMAGTRAVLTCSVVAISDVLEDDEFGPRDVAVATGFRSVLAVPLVRDGSPIGAIAVGRPEPGPFPDQQLALLQTFADQAVIAIENVRLFKELEARNRDLTEALEQQTATSEILRVISRSQTDVQPVFDTIAAAALKLCRASSANLVTFDGELLHIAALAIVNPEGADAVRRLYPRPRSRDTAATRAVLTGRVVAIPDVLEDPEYAVGASAVAGGFRSVLAVPLMREKTPIGVILVGRPDPGPFPDKQIVLLQTFADQAVIAIENVRLFKELEARTIDLTRSVGELKALGDVGQAVSSTLDLETVLNTIVSRATQLTGMDGGSIWEYDETREEFYLHATDKLPDELVEALRATPIKKGEGALGRLAVTGEPVQVRDIVDEGVYQSRVREILIRLGYRSLLAVPLLREDHLLGGLSVNRKSAGDFAPEVIDLLKTFATQSALAIQNARLFREIEVKSRELETASRHKSEFLANMSHELRTPLNAIIGFSEVLSERMFGEINDKQAEYLTDILESGRHLLSLINDILDLSKIEAGRMELEPTDFDLPAAIENTLILVRERAQRRGITLGRTVDERLGMIRADERKLKQVLLNLLSNALKFTPEGGQIDVQARAHNGEAEISVADTGVGIAPEDQEAVFEEFRQVGTAARKVEGTGLGLAISRKFIELHGGRIWVKSQVGMGSTFAFTVPLMIDRRHPTGS